MVATGTLISASWILASNSWMQTPAGYIVDKDGIFHVSDWAPRSSTRPIRTG